MPLSLLSAKVLRVRPVGVTSDFCPVCRCERRFKLALAGHHRYTLCLDRGPVGQIHHELTCVVCAARVERSADERDVRVVPGKGAVGTHEPEALPIVRSRIEDCARMEQARREGKLKPDQREELIRHAMYCFARIYDEDSFERLTPFVKLLILLGCLLVMALGYWGWRESGNVWALVGAAGAVVTIFGALLYWVTKHSPRKRVRGWLAQSLAPLDPSREEIRRIRAELQGSRIKAGFRIRSDKLIAKIKKVRAGS